jgi:hypothetical protein
VEGRALAPWRARTSSTITTEYAERSGSAISSRISRPSVMYLSRVVCASKQSSKRTA